MPHGLLGAAGPQGKGEIKVILTVTLNASVDKLYEVERLVPQTVMRVRQVRQTAGGKGLNVARIAALAGHEVTAMGFVGGHNGSLLESLITERAITKAFTHVGAPTRCCVNVWDEAAGRSTEFLEPGSPVTQEDAAFFVKDYEEKLPLADAVVLSGSLPPGLPDTYYSLLVELAKRQGKPVLADTSGAALQSVVRAGPTFLKPNAEEVRQLLDMDTASLAGSVAAAKQLHRAGIPVAAVSLGKQGVLVACAEGVYHGITPDIPVVNTVGCGDSMVAGFAVGLACGWDIADTIHYAVSVSTANAMNRKTGYYEQADLDRVRPLVRVERLA